MPQLSEAQENALANARRTQQDRTNPLLIHVKDGRLMPNTPKLRANPDYRVFTGSRTASHDERMAFLASMNGSPRGARRVVGGVERAKAKEQAAPATSPVPFDLSKAGKLELIAFAASEYQLVLDEKMTLADMRQAVAQAAEMHNALGDDLS